MCKCGADFASSANTRITVQSFTAVDDGAGGRTETWVDAFLVWAEVEPMAGREIYVNSQLQSRVDARMTIRYKADLSNTQLAAKYRVKVGDRVYNIQYVRNLEDDMKHEGRDFQQLLCVEGEPS